jgi:hypothetical protein
MWNFLANQVPRVSTENIPKVTADQGRIDETVTIIFGVLGTIAVLMFVIGGIQYITSKGNPGDMAKAKDTLVYAAVGMAIVILSYSIVAFVISSI